MSTSIPKNIITEIRDLVFARLDKHQWLAQGRRENGQFMNDLATDPEIGGRIAEFIGKAKVKTYIKDALINKYSKDRTKPPSDLSKIVSDVIGCPCTKISNLSKNNVQVYRGKNGDICLVSHGRFIKWESALRKLLEYVVVNQSSFSKDPNIKPILLLLVNVAGKPLTDPDRSQLIKCLKTINVHVRFF